MRVTLLRFDGLDVAMSAASVCVSEDMPTEPKPEGLIAALKSGHDSLLEHITVSFAIEGISRVTEAQLIRHRMASYAIQSGRYCDRDPTTYVTPVSLPKSDAMLSHDMALSALDEDLRAKGTKAEDRRYLYPQGIATNLIMTCNLREFSHICGLRRCTRAQEEIHVLASMMAGEVSERIYRKVGPAHPQLYRILSRRLMPQCAQLGYCPEAKGCGLMPTLTDLQDAYYTWKKEGEE